ncbi:hypothetical protein NB311A_01175 [Nitrobacter sp. Nb-311A]|nr:hypothetical protein NB311A_01175 [Nitrobacter sp. Nb-311A]
MMLIEHHQPLHDARGTTGYILKMVKKDDRLNVRIDESLRAALEQAAADDQRTLSSLVAKVLSEWARKRGYLK